MSDLNTRLYIGLMALGAFIPLMLALAFSIHMLRLVSACRFHALAVLAAVSIAVGGVLTFVAVATYWDLFGPGMVLSLSSLGSAAIAFSVTLLVGTVVVVRRKRPEWLRQLAALYLVGGLIYPGSQAVVGIGTFGLISYCDHQNGQTAASIIPTLDHYKSDHGNYPKSLADMVPQYLDGYPTSPCHRLNIYERNTPATNTFVLNRCDDGEALLVVQYTYAFWRVKVYSTASQTWDNSAEFVQGCYVFH